MTEDFDEQLSEVRNLSRMRWLQARAADGVPAAIPEGNEGDSTFHGKKRSLTECANKTKGVKRMRLNEGAEGKVDDLLVLSWNLDGLMEENLPGRTLAVIDTIRKLKPALILLQEVVPISEAILRRYLSKPYTVIEPATQSDWTPPGGGESLGTKGGYYCLMLISTFHFQAPGSNRTFFYTHSAMNRHLLTVTLKSKSEPSHEVVVGTTHLESCQSEKAERLEQLQICLDWMAHEALHNSNAATTLVLFAGDLNIRDNEVKLKQEFLNRHQIKDAWIEMGCDSKSRFTWDMLLNRNLDGARGRSRFDRIWFHCGEACPVRLTDFRLVGTEMIDEDSLRIHPSDHFGLIARFAPRERDLYVISSHLTDDATERPR